LKVILILQPIAVNVWLCLAQRQNNHPEICIADGVGKRKEDCLVYG
jgi:hypothetical protein